MEHTALDIKFLVEFSQFSCKCSYNTAKILRKSHIEAIKNMEYDNAAYFLIKLNSEMCVLLELVIALLYSFSKWDKEGILNTMVDYRFQKVDDFISKLIKSSNPLELICFPKKEDLLKTVQNKKEVNQGYKSEDFKIIIAEIIKLYDDEYISALHNKLKHGSIFVRDPSYILPVNQLSISQHTNIFIAYKKNKKIKTFNIPHMGEKANKKREEFFKIINHMTEMASKLSEAVANYLTVGIMQKSK